MGKEWFNWGGSGKFRRKKIPVVEEEAEETTAPLGCMCVFQPFNLNYLPLAFRHQPRPSLSPQTYDADIFQDEPTVLRELEAPKNSLEIEESFVEASSFSPPQMPDQDLNFQVGMRIRTTYQTKSLTASNSPITKAKSEDILSSECSSSPGTKTPNLVARLMGLDLLPETTSPSLSSSRNSTSSHRHNIHQQIHNQNQDYIFKDMLQTRPCSNERHDLSGTISLPETPRVSSCRRSDVERHRLSLQIHKENVAQELEISALTTKKKSQKNQGDRERTAERYKTDILKQVKESVSRRFGLDMTNTIRSKEQRKDSNLVDTKNKPIDTTPLKKNQDPKCPRLLQDSVYKDNNKEVQKPNAAPLKKKLGQTSNRVRKPPQGCDDAIRSKKEELFVHSTPTNKPNLSDRKAKKTPLSSDLLNINVSMKNNPSFPADKKFGKQLGPNQSSQAIHDSPTKKSTQLSITTSIHDPYHHQKQHLTPTPHTFQENNIQPTNIHESQQHRYIQRILKRTGIDKNTPLSLATWYSTSHPLDPAYFNFLELFHPTKSDPSCQRKLLFHLVDELLVEILKPYVKLRSRKCCQIKGSELFEILCNKVGSFPSANCQVLEDIDALIDHDFQRSELEILHAFEEEGEEMVMDIENYIMEALLDETAATVALNGGRCYRETVTASSDGSHVVRCGGHYSERVGHM